VRTTFAERVAAARPRVVAVAARLVGDEAEDVAQEAALRAFLSLSQLRDPARFEAWLCGIAINLAKMRLRRAAIHQRVLAAAGPPPPAPDDHELLDLVRDAVDVLPPAQREAVLLHYVDDLSCDEVAALLDTTPGAVRVRLHRARGQLRHELAPQLAPTPRPKEKPMIETTLTDVLVRFADGEETVGDLRILVLRERDGARHLPIWIGDPEGNALAMHLHDMKQPRPMTADLMVELVRALGGEVRQVTITKLEEKVYYATIGLGDAEVDARPSDAINLAVRTGAPILVAEPVLDEQGVDSEGLAEKLERDADEIGMEIPPGRWASLTGELLAALYKPPGK
jgi:hypothetical protein